jgi:hypothetical protein
MEGEDGEECWRRYISTKFQSGIKIKIPSTLFLKTFPTCSTPLFHNLFACGERFNNASLYNTVSHFY